MFGMHMNVKSPIVRRKPVPFEYKEIGELFRLDEIKSKEVQKITPATL